MHSRFLSPRFDVKLLRQGRGQAPIKNNKNLMNAFELQLPEASVPLRPYSSNDSESPGLGVPPEEYQLVKSIFNLHGTSLLSCHLQIG